MSGNMEKILRLMAEQKASDVYMSANAPITIKTNGVCVPVNTQPLPTDGALQLLSEVITPEQVQELKNTGELNVAVPVAGAGRFRISAMRQRGSYAVVIRFISVDIPPIASLKIPEVLPKLIMAKRRLMLLLQIFY